MVYSTLYFSDFQCILNISQIGNGMPSHNIMYRKSIINLLQNIIGIVKNTWVQKSCNYG